MEVRLIQLETIVAHQKALLDERSGTITRQQMEFQVLEQ